MDPNTHSVRPADGLTALAAAVDRLAAQDLDGLSDAVRAERVLVLRRLVDRLEGHWLHELADLDARGAAGAEQGVQVGSTAAWLRHRLRMGAGAATSAVRTARALFGGARGRHPRPPRPPHRRRRTRPAGRGPPPRSTPAATGHRPPAAGRRPDTAASQTQQRHQRRGLWLASTLDGMVAVEGCWNPRSVRACWRPWSR